MVGQREKSWCHRKEPKNKLKRSYKFAHYSVSRLKQLIALFLLLFFVGCSTKEVVDHWKDLEDNQWIGSKPVTIPVEISDTGHYYNVFINLRVTNAYKYSNLWLKLQIKDPIGKATEDQIMLTLANHRGKWVGHNLGQIISFQIPTLKDKVFGKPGTYTFRLEQFMRDSVLKEVVSAGIKLEKQQKILK